MYKIIFLFAVAFIVSCSTSKKASTNSPGPVDAITSLQTTGSRSIASLEGAEFIYQQTLNALINPKVKTISLQPLAGEELENEKRTLRLENFKRLISRYKENFYIGESLLIDYDNELEVAYKNHKAKKEVSLDKLREKHLNILIGREYIEFHTHEMIYVYESLLDISHGRRTGDKRVADELIGNLKDILSDQWTQGNRLAVFNLGIHFDDYNEELKKRDPKLKVPGIKRYTFRDIENMNTLATRSRTFQSKFQATMISQESLSSWLRYRDERLTEISAQREPDSDNLRPDSGSTGNINGSKLPANIWAMTYDDGPHPAHTKGMTDAMKRHGMKGTFFWLSANMKRYPEIVGQVGKFGHKRASHSFTHQNLPKLSEAKLQYEISSASDEFKSMVGAAPTFFRCPYGACGGNNSRIRKLIADKDMIHVSWNVDSLDWQDKSPKSIYNRVVKQMEINGRGIVLFHDIHPQSVAAVDLLMTYFKSHPELKFHTMDQVVNIVRSAAGNDNQYTSP